MLKDILAAIGVVAVWLLLGWVGLRYSYVLDAICPSGGRTPAVWVVGGPFTLVLAGSGGLFYSSAKNRETCGGASPAREP